MTHSLNGMAQSFTRVKVDTTGDVMILYYKSALTCQVVGRCCGRLRKCLHFALSLRKYRRKRRLNEFVNTKIK